MRHFFLVGIIVLFFPGAVVAQTSSTEARRHMFRILEEDDCFDVRGMGTDEAYTNGTRIDYFYMKRGRDHFIDRWLMPGAGKKAVSTYGWGLMQTMYTPKDLKMPEFQPNDYAFAGALFLIHSKESFNPAIGYALKTEIVTGVMGPLSMADKLQTYFHHLFHFKKPLGWPNQLPNDVLLNYSLQYEHRLYRPADWLEVRGGGKAMVGTMQDGAVLQLPIRVGWFRSYFDGYFAQNNSDKHSYQFYFEVTPSIQYTAFNSLLEGGVFNDADNHPSKVADYGSKVRRINESISCGAFLVKDWFSASFTQHIAKGELKGTRDHFIGSIAVAVSW